MVTPDDVKIAIEHGLFEIVDLPINSMVNIMSCVCFAEGSSMNFLFQP